MSEDVSGQERRPLGRRRLYSATLAMVLLRPDLVSGSEMNPNTFKNDDRVVNGDIGDKRVPKIVPVEDLRKVDTIKIPQEGNPLKTPSAFSFPPSSVRSSPSAFGETAYEPFPGEIQAKKTTRSRSTSLITEPGRISYRHGNMEIPDFVRPSEEYVFSASRMSESMEESISDSDSDEYSEEEDPKEEAEMNEENPAGPPVSSPFKKLLSEPFFEDCVDAFFESSPSSELLREGFKAFGDWSVPVENVPGNVSTLSSLGIVKLMYIFPKAYKHMTVKDRRSVVKWFRERFPLTNESSWFPELESDIWTDLCMSTDIARTPSKRPKDGGNEDDKRQARKLAIAQEQLRQKMAQKTITQEMQTTLVIPEPEPELKTVTMDILPKPELPEVVEEYEVIVLKEPVASLEISEVVHEESFVELHEHWDVTITEEESIERMVEPSKTVLGDEKISQEAAHGQVPKRPLVGPVGKMAPRSRGPSERGNPAQTSMKSQAPTTTAQQAHKKQSGKRIASARTQRLAFWTMFIVIIGFSLLGFGMYQLAAFDPVVF